MEILIAGRTPVDSEARCSVPLDMSVAQIILSQLGGNKFVKMTGAKNLTSDGNSLIFKLPSRFALEGINCVKITLDPSDTYTMVFYRQGRAPSFKVNVVAEISGVYCDQLCEIFEAKTGLATSL